VFYAQISPDSLYSVGLKENLQFDTAGCKVTDGEIYNLIDN